MAIITNWFSGTIEALSFKVFTGIACSVYEKFMKIMERIFLAVFIFVLALGGSIIGTIGGAIKGQTTETGFLDGACRGAIAGAIAAIEFVSFASVGQSFSKVALLTSLLNGKVFMEWICPTVAQAYIFMTPWELQGCHKLVLSNFHFINSAPPTK
ncbi:unnamed protein product [Lathyrus sativus]|nr:unnamed protein product [Lathyrus sativus]